MPIISLKRYMNDSKEDAVFRRTISALMQGMVLHAVQGDQNDFDKLHLAFNEIDATVPDEAGAAELLKAAGAAIQKLAEYNDRTTRFLRLQSTELHHMIGMLAETVISIASCSERSSEGLKEIEQGLEQAVALGEVQQLKRRLGECLSTLREQAKRQKSENEAETARMRERLDRARERVHDLGNCATEIDSVTGLPMQADAEAAIAQALEDPDRRTYVAAFLVDRIQAVNLRYGYAVGDRLLASVAESVRSQLSAPDRLFRWRGPGMIALIDRRESVDLIRGQVARASVSPKQQLFDVGGREVMIPVSASWCLLPLRPPAENIVKRLQSFISGTPVEN